MLEDKARLVKRTQLKRSVYRVLGKEEGNVGEEVSHDSHLKSHDEEIYDEDDFYHQVSYALSHFSSQMYFCVYYITCAGTQ